MTARVDLESDGRFEHGRIVLDKPPALPEGALLHVRITLKKDNRRTGWPEGFFERTAGQITDPGFERPPQGDYEIREPLDGPE